MYIQPGILSPFFWIFTGYFKNTVKEIILYKNDTKNSLCKSILHNLRWTVTNKKEIPFIQNGHPWI